MKLAPSDLDQTAVPTIEPFWKATSGDVAGRPAFESETTGDQDPTPTRTEAAARLLEPSNSFHTAT